MWDVIYAYENEAMFQAPRMLIAFAEGFSGKKSTARGDE